MSVAENMAFGLRNIGATSDVIKQRIANASRMLEMEELLQRRPSQLSGGQRQRVAIGRAIVKEPKAFLFDEPLSNLDASLRARTRVELAELHQRLRSTMIYVTHDQVEAMTLADRIVILNKCRIEQVGDLRRRRSAAGAPRRRDADPDPQCATAGGNFRSRRASGGAYGRGRRG
jgi:multiple sugar transport system ATP-binding protein